MTTLAALNTMDSLVMGCDTLGTVTQMFISPSTLLEYFDPTDQFSPKLGADGKPLLDNFSKIIQKCQEIPYYHMTHVDKLFPLKPLPMGVMFAGTVAIGDRSIKNLISEFRSKELPVKKRPNAYALRAVGEKLLEFVWSYYSREYPEEWMRQPLELMLGGYDSDKPTPGVVRIVVDRNELREPEYSFRPFFGGQTKEIERLVHGTDIQNEFSLLRRTQDLLNRYHQLLTQQLQANGITLHLKEPGDFGAELNLFEKWSLEGLRANWGAFSEQNAIDCVDFLVNLVVSAHQFSAQMPTVGGEVQIAVIKKDKGFQFVSKREWRHGEHAVEAQE